MLRFNFKRGFTLTEILISLAILGVLGATLFSSFGSSDEKSKRIVAKDSLHELSKSLQNFVRETGTLPSPKRTDGVTDQSIEYVGFLSSKSSFSSYVGKYKTDKNGIVLINNEPVFYTKDITGKYFVIGVNTVSLDSIAFAIIPTANAAGKDFITETNFNGMGNVIMNNSGSEMSYSDTNQTSIGYRVYYMSPSEVSIILSKTGASIPTFSLKKNDGSLQVLTIKNADGTAATSDSYNLIATSSDSSFKIDSQILDSNSISAFAAPGDSIPVIASAASAPVTPAFSWVLNTTQSYPGNMGTNPSYSLPTGYDCLVLQTNLGYCTLFVTGMNNGHSVSDITSYSITGIGTDLSVMQMNPGEYRIVNAGNPVSELNGTGQILITLNNGDSYTREFSWFLDKLGVGIGN